jgi:hypothetical protein
MTIFNPDSWMDVLTIIAVSAMVAIPSWFAARNHKGITKLDKSISNGHTYPLRQDVDEIRSTLNDIRTDVHGLRRDLADESTRRRDHIEELRSEVNRKLGKRAS